MLIAFELAPAVDVVIGPVASVRDALELLSGEEVHAAILDVRPVDRDVAPIAAALLEEERRWSSMRLPNFQRRSPTVLAQVRLFKSRRDRIK